MTDTRDSTFHTRELPAAIVFDLDGTLLDTLDDLADCVNEVLTEAGLPIHPSASYKKMVGTGWRNLISIASGQVLPDDRAALMLERFSTAYANGWQRKTRPYDGIHEALRQIAARGVPMSVLSNKFDAMTRRMVSHYFPDIPFVAVIGQRPGVPDKPDPASALEISARMGILPERTAYVGDSGTDMLTARRAGMFPVGVLWGFRDRAELTDAGAAVLLARSDELPGLMLPPAAR